MARGVWAALAAGGLLLAGSLPAAASVGTAPRQCPTADGRVDSVAIRDQTAYVGGSFTHVTDGHGEVFARARLAAVDTVSCEVLPWSPDVSGEVLAIAPTDTTVFIGGSFSSVDDTPRPKLAALDRATGRLVAFGATPNRTVRALALSADRLYVGGDFTKVGSVARGSLAAFMLDSGALDGAWKPTASGRVTTLANSPEAGRVYVGGTFQALNGEADVAKLAAVDNDTGTLDRSFVPSPGWDVLDVVADTRGVYVGGGGAGGHVVIWNLDGTLQRPVYQTDGGVQSVSVDGDSLYAGGHFTNYCIGNTGTGSPFVCDKPLNRRKAFEISLSTGELTGWAPVFNSPRGIFASDVEPVSHDLWVGGDFTTVNAKTLPHLAVLPSSSG